MGRTFYTTISLKQDKTVMLNQRSVVFVFPLEWGGTTVCPADKIKVRSGAQSVGEKHEKQLVGF